VFFKNRRKERGEDLNRKVEKFRQWWQDETPDLSPKRQDAARENRPDREPSDSSFVYYEEN
jgi:hypothetical protein